MLKYSGASPSCCIVAFLYLEKLKEHRPSLLLTSRTIQRLLLVATMLAAKYLEDVTVLNSRW